MKKNFFRKIFSLLWGRYRKLLCIMKLSFIILLLSFVHVSASTYSQATKLSIKLNKGSVEQLIKEIKKKSDFDFIFDYELIKGVKSTDLNEKNSKVEKILNKALKGTNIDYKIKDKVIILVPAKPIPKMLEVVLKAQNMAKITGVVKDTDGKVIPFATVIVKGSTRGVAADVNGKFTIDVMEVKNTILLVSSIGYIKREIKLKDKKPLEIFLKQDTQSIDEVVVTGYGTIEKRKLSSSVVSVKLDEIKEGAALSVDNMLQGKIAGMTVMSNTSTPGAAPKIRIRGTSSISGNREPVWVVDDVILDDPVPISAADLNSFDNVNLIGNAISSINPEDIDRIDVLKDASATAIYGSKAANGVIVITTKKGKMGRPTVTFSNTTSITERPSYDDLNLMNSKERIDISREIYNRGLKFGHTPAHVGYEGALYDLFAKKITQDQFAQQVKQLEENNTDWFDLLFRTAITQSNNLSISGADSKTNYYFSAGYSDQQSTGINSGVKRFTSLMKLNFKLTNKLKVGFQLRGTIDKRKYNHNSVSVFSYARGTSRAIPCYDKEGDLVFYNKDKESGNIYKYNVLNELNNSGNEIQNRYLNFNTNISYKFNKWLTYRGLVSINTSDSRDEKWYNDKTYLATKARGIELNEWDVRNADLKANSSLPYGGQLNSNNTSLFGYTVRNTFVFNKTFGDKHELSSNIGSEIRSSNYEGLKSVQRGYLPDRGKKFAIINPVEYPKYNEWLLKYPNVITDKLTRFVSFFGTLTYAYDNRYSFNFNYRTDGSNKFGQSDSNKFLPIYSGSARWNIHNENFLLGNNLVNNLALRFSYGIQGNVAEDDTPKLIVKQQGINATSGEYGSSIVRLPNPELRWEKTESYNLGLDFSLFKSRFSGTLELYRKKGTDMLVSRSISPTSGVNTIKVNGGDMENKGWEVFLRGDVLKYNDFSWSLTASAAKNYNKVTDAGSARAIFYGDYINGNLIKEGEPIDGFYSYKFDGLNENGYPIFKDVELKDKMTEEQMLQQAFTYSGQKMPDLDGSFTSSFKYKDLSLRLGFTYSFGRKIRLNKLYSSYQRLPQPQQNMSGEFVDRWRKVGDEKNTNIPTLSDQSMLLGSGLGFFGYSTWDMYNNSDLRVVSGDFVRLSNITLKYYLPKSFCEKLKMKSANVSFQANDLYVWASSKLNGQDPEQSSLLGFGSMPRTTSYVMNFSVKF